MKRTVCAALAAALLAPGMWAATARAQDDDAGPEMAEHHDGGSADHPMMGDRMKKRLELTDDQAAKFKDAMKAHHDAMQPLWESAKASMKKLGEQLKAKAPDSEIQASLDALKANHQAIAAEETKFQDGLSFLTPTQRAKMLMGAMRMRREGMRGPGKRGPKGDNKKGGDKDGDDDKGE